MLETLKVIGEILGYAAGAAILYILFFIRDRFKKHPGTIKKNDVGIYKAVYEEMSLLMATGADRVYILEFHNGTEFSSNILQWKLSCTYELARNGVSRMQDRLQNIMASTLPLYLSTFYSERDEQLLDGVSRADICHHCQSCNRQCTYKFDIDDMNESSLTAELKLQGIYGMFQVGIRNSSGSLIGILGLDYTKVEHWITVNESEGDIPHTLKSSAMKLARIWENKK